MLARARFPGESEAQDVAIKVINMPTAVSRARARAGQCPSTWMTMIPTARSINSKIKILKTFLDPATRSHSPFLTPLLAAFQDGTNVYLVMRMYPETLAHRLQRSAAAGTKLEVDEIRLYAAEIPCALRALHEDHHTVHRDLKFQNILIAPSGHLALADFGLAKRAEGARDVGTLGVGKAGTLPYLAPEVFKPLSSGALPSSFCGAPLDIWAFGMLVLEMFEAARFRPHFFGKPRDGEDTAVPNVHALVGEPDAADLIDRIVNRNYKDRLTLSEIRRHAFFSPLIGIELNDADMRVSLNFFSACFTAHSFPTHQRPTDPVPRSPYAAAQCELQHLLDAEWRGLGLEGDVG
ncbi:kinase-like domain-containing protein [Mycena latifolia]|nr:kinase-like domain-containing protein [Mycena latifolia]